MTDGCGLANYDFFRVLQEQQEWPGGMVPSAVQIRLNGSKVIFPSTMLYGARELN